MSVRELKSLIKIHILEYLSNRLRYILQNRSNEHIDIEDIFDACKQRTFSQTDTDGLLIRPDQLIWYRGLISTCLNELIKAEKVERVTVTYGPRPHREFTFSYQLAHQRYFQICSTYYESDPDAAYIEFVV